MTSPWVWPAARILQDVPVDPDAGTAREWAEAELADPIYHQGQSLLDRIVEWLVDLVNDARASAVNVDARTAGLVLVAILAVVLVAVLLYTGPVRRARRARASTEVFEDDARSAAEMRASADALAAAGRWSEAVLDRFRALLRSLEERAVLAERPGWTADEAAAEAGLALPGCAGDLRRASALFDDIRYGDRRARAEDDAWLRTVDDAVRTARPVAHAEAPEPTLAVPR
ncbi:DUF4129 domain-containing protein [Actinotalea fermentans]|uniref:DUF4129 domain-containing protein n=1 Tax=Actinotalea fermentans TaxID=43671 RepID=UPI0011BDAA59|nr:DUF4129 domain-containing protein [Actinotalea fermentans]